MPMSWKRTPSEIKLLQRAISHPDAADLGGLVEALDATVENRLWAEQRLRGKPLETFSEFVLLPSPSGLGVQSIKYLRFLRQLLIDGGHYAEWVEVMERTLRPRGRPRKTLANGDDFCRCYPYPRTRNSRDYIATCSQAAPPRGAFEPQQNEGRHTRCRDQSWGNYAGAKEWSALWCLRHRGC